MANTPGKGKASPKKSSTRRSNSQKEASKETTLRKELQSLIKDIDEEGLAFLIEQANTILYNMKVEDLNKQAESLNKSRTRARQSEGKSKEKSKSGQVTIEPGRMGKGYILVIDGERKIMDEVEIFKLVKIAHTAASKKAACEQLYRWIERNRDDIILDTGLAPTGPKVEALYTYLKAHFSLKG
jgi:hypothetical protein